MRRTYLYPSPLGGILLSSEGDALTGLWFEGQKNAPNASGAQRGTGAEPVLKQTARWLDIYFAGREPEFTPNIRLCGTLFQNEVWRLLLAVPYGSVTTYADIARKIARLRGIARMSAQAVGGAVGRNPISLIVPCHRVTGAHGSLGGYAGGLDRKEKLLRLEGAWKDSFSTGLLDLD